MRPRILLFGICTSTSLYTLAQGCSDAGVCSAGTIGQIHLLSDSAGAAEPRHYARLQYGFGVGEQGVSIMQVIPELSLGLSQRLSVQLKVPYVSASGELGDNAGVGDAILTGSYRFVNEVQRGLTGSLGFRLPTGKTDAGVPDAVQSFRDRALPMPYQTGLGSIDLLAGIEWRRGRWIVAAAYQHVLSQGNGNSFTALEWADKPEAADYFPAAQLRRANDAVVRFQYLYRRQRLALQPGMLAIYHLSNDTRLDRLQMVPLEAIRATIDGSQGLTLNATLDVRYTLNDHWALELSGGTPLVTRDNRPDGLTRALVLNSGVRFTF